MRQSDDSYERMIQGKVAGTYRPDSLSEPPRFAFETRLAQEQSTIIPNPAHVLSAKEATTERSLSSYERKGAWVAPSSPSRDTARAQFHNYGWANIHPTNSDLYLTTFNVKAATGVNPHTVMKSRMRPFVMSEFRKPKPVTSVRIHQPAFYGNMRDVQPDERGQTDGPFWMYWPSDDPFPPQYAELEKVVRNQKKSS
jgi:hypothetical protein